MRLRRFVTSALALVLLAATARAVADAPAKQPITPLDAAALANRIDELIAKKWAEKKVQPAPLADDAEFLRRVYLDLAGRIPRTSEVREFLADKNPQKRQRLVSRLLDSPLHVGHLSATWRSIILPTTNQQQFQLFSGPFGAWLDKQVKENVPYDLMVRELLTVNLGAGPNPRGVAPPLSLNQTISPAGFYQANELKAENLAASTSRLFLGVRLECAQCHDHPFAKWTRAQFWEYAAFFSAVQPQQPRVLPQPGRQPQPFKAPNGREIKIAGTDKIVQARFLNGQNPQWKDGIDSRVTLADWLTAPENPFFAKTGANRIWSHLLGIGIIDPVDDEPCDENPASHPGLLEELAEQFVAHKFDVKFMIRAITLSETYRRTSRATHDSQADPRAFGRMALRGMTPEQLFDSLAQATGYSETLTPRDGRIVVLGGAQGPRAEFLLRFAGQDKRTETQTTILQALALMNGKFVADATSVERSMTLTAAAEFPGWSTTQRVEAIYLAALSRLPRQEEAIRMVSYVDGGGPTGDRRRALADVFWALLNSSEFILNH